MSSKIGFLLICGLLSSILSAEETAKSNLKLISEEFRILSRVINAISLQASIIRNEIEDRAFIAEILQIDNDTLNSIVSVHFDNAVFSEIERMSREKEIIDFSKYKQARNVTIKILEAFLFLNKTDEILATMRDSTNLVATNSGKFWKKVAKNNRCYHLDTVKFRKFTTQLMQDAESRNGDGKKTIAILSGFYHQFQIFRDCLKNISTLQDAINNKLKKCEKRKIFKHVAKYIQLILYHQQNFHGFDYVYGHIINILKLAEGLLNVASNSETEINAMTESAMDKILLSVGALKQQNENHSRATLIYTPGFENVNDMLRVFDDLKSPWFLRKVARNETAKHLERALQSYKHIAESLISLQVSWREFVNKTRAIVANKSVSDGVRGIAMIKKFQYFYPDYFNLLKNSKEQVPRCMELLNANLMRTLLKFVELQKPGEAVCDSIENINKSVFIMNSYLLETGDEKTNLLSYIGNATDRIDDVLKEGASSTNAISLENSIYEKLNETGVIFKMIEEVTVLLSNLQNLKEHLKKEPEKLSLQTFEFRKLDEFLKCFQNNVDVWKMYQILKTYVGILDFPSADTLNKTNEYLKDLAVFQHKLAAIEEILKYDQLNQTISDTSSSVLAFNSSITKIVGTSVKVLEDLDELRNHRQQLMEFKAFKGFAYRCLRDSNLLQWANPEKRLHKMIKYADEVNSLATNIRNKTLIEMCQVFEVAARIEGILESPQQLYRLIGNLERGGNRIDAKAAGQFRSILNLDMEFSKHQAQLKGAQSAVISLIHYFNGIKVMNSHANSHANSHSQGLLMTLPIDERDAPLITLTTAVLIGIALIFIVLIIVLMIYGVTKRGRLKYKSIYLRYLKPEIFGERWRYSAFTDNQDGENLLLNAARLSDEVNLVKALKSGAYVNAYNKSGNTALHVTTQNGDPAMAEHLILYGANRSLLNAKNKTAEELIPLFYRYFITDVMIDYKIMHKIYDHHRNRTYRIGLPRPFPVSSFRIYTDESTEVTLRNNFLLHYPAISSNKVMAITTHVIAKTDENGILVTDRLDVLSWIFKGSILMQEKWMSDCLLEKTMIELDTIYRVESVKFKGVIYNTVLSWSEAIAKALMPYLHGVYVAIVIKKYKNLSLLSDIITSQGGSMLESIPDKEKFNLGSHPYLHVHLGPIFLIHDGTSDLSVYKNDEHKMYTLFTEEEFIIFMLKNEINRDKNKNPISVLK